MLCFIITATCPVAVILNLCNICVLGTSLGNLFQQPYDLMGGGGEEEVFLYLISIYHAPNCVHCILSSFSACHFQEESGSISSFVCNKILSYAVSSQSLLMLGVIPAPVQDFGFPNAESCGRCCAAAAGSS